MIEVEDKYMARCIALARGGLGYTSPNPMVGAVVVYNGKIIGEGFHRKCGGPHAEVNAIASVKNESMLKDSTLYVSLEPCSHYGKTPPCAELIIKKQIPRVVVGCLDPFPEVSGRGVRMLRDAGVEVVTGVLEKEAYELNLPFMMQQTRKRPYILLKWAQSSDGYMDIIRKDSSVPPVVLSSQETLRMVHKLRSEMDAIMVGTNTALLDNPSLTVRYWAGKSPVRIVLDRNLLIPSHYHLLDGSVLTYVLTEREMENRKNIEYIRMDFSQDILPQIMDFLCKHKINSLMVEGGSYLLRQFINHDLWDKIRVETAPFCLNEGVAAPDRTWLQKVAYSQIIGMILQKHRDDFTKTSGCFITEYIHKI
ncbi:bifunctional diaminohydroxyphosphoribosylaminopyrimidine deaminase/5-amino-6-(5-phosphoribosylamino)uracil reductase RibD [Parabacteroides bouchesdurhonensis]|uniref:bifunctional diaminohydroxyphosphoribosylaminopyrimidine deaminase/5-amino-6-(5-phosphoribosylamino)uracil reductase RibD n=1 Tax=Parabacteroides bouchesdurhonensis TaxID=1936995 RepID=UPI000C81C007|nr:bifunctional diaminohydroxyphosphoribosylaminopyrimidine deaminase/5-amino-6-(5-phosphoribosylamino)uracil reductase RibD [Parabacteroides bouchesdurhonensis]